MNRLRRTVLRAWLFAAFGVALVGPAPTAGASHVVIIRDTLEPATLAVAPGDQVTWRNDDGVRHRVRTTSGPGEFDSGDLDPGQSFSVTLTSIGTYAYRDERNKDQPAYWGTVVVATAPPSPTPGASASSAPTGGAPTPPPAAITVHMAGRTFSPEVVTIAIGGSVTWRNDDDRQHTVSAAGGSFDSGVLNPGASYSRSFAQAGTFAYLCRIHPDMTGTVLVSPGPGATPPPPAPTPVVSSPPTTGGGATSGAVAIVDFDFRPNELTVDAGVRVTFVNRGAALHTVTATDGSFDSGLLDPGASYSRTFTTPGTYPFLCAVHPAMSGTVRVRGPGGATAPPAPSQPPVTTPPSGARIVDFAFEPPTLRITAGSTVSWINAGVAPHTVTAEDGSFNSGILPTGAGFTWRFDAAGTFPYLCAVHPSMVASIVVEPGPAGPASTGAPAAPPALSGAGEGTAGGLPADAADGAGGGAAAAAVDAAGRRISIGAVLLIMLTLLLAVIALGGWLFVLADVPGVRRPAR